MDTDRDRTEAALRESEQWFRLAFQKSPLGVAIAGLDFRLLRVNEALCAMLGYTERELKGRTFVDITHPDDIATDVGLAEQLFRNEIPGYQIEKRYLTKNGGIVWIELTGTVVRGDDGRALYGLGIIQDITRRKAAEEEIARRRDEAEDHAARLGALARLNQLVSSSLDMGEVLREIARAAAELMRAPFVSFWVADEAAKTLTAGGFSDDRIGASFPSTTLSLDQSLMGWVARERRPLGVADALTDAQTLAPEWWRVHGLTSFYGVPVVLGDSLFAVLALNGRAPFRIGPAEESLIGSFAAQAAIAIRNARLFAQSEERRRTAEALRDVGRLLSETLDPDVVSQLIADRIPALVGALTAGVYRLDPRSGELVAVAVSGDVGRAIGRNLVFPPGTGTVGLAVAEGRAAATQDFLSDPRIALPPELRARLEPTPHRAVLAVPLLAQSRVIGVLAVGDRTGRVFTEDDRRVASAFADQAAVAFENARLYAEAEQRRREAEAFAELNRDINASLDLAVVLQRVADAARDLCGADVARIALRNPRSGAMTFAYSAGPLHPAYQGITIEPGQGLGGQVLLTGRPFRTDDYGNDPRITKDFIEAVRADGVVAAMGVPVQIEARIEGLLFVGNRSPRPFTDRDEAVLARLADHAATAIHNARLYGELQAALDQVEAAQQQIVQAERLRAVGSLASGVAHHLNNLLAVILGRIEILLAKVGEPEIRRSLEIAMRAALEGAEVVRRVRTFVQVLPAADMSPVDLNHLVRETLELTRSRWQDQAQARGVVIDASFEPGEVAPVIGDSGALREALLSLLLNAIDAVADGGEVRVRTWESNDRVHCSVSDTGAGMSEEARQRALEPFFTTKGPQSTGLGLSVAYGVVQRHGGRLLIESGKGPGTTVTFDLPAARTPSADHATAPVAPAAPLRILVVDDERDLRELLADILTEQGHSTVEAAGGGEALARLEAGERVDLVLTDLGMPRMTGRELARAIKARWPHLPVGGITGWDEGPEVAEAEREGVDFVIVKPFASEEIRAAIARLRP